VNRRGFIFGLVFLAVLAERGWVLGHALPTDFDDAYMFVRYANNWLGGHGLAWNPGEAPVYGVTSPLHFVVVTLGRWLFPGLGDGALLRACSAGAALLLVLTLAVLGARVARRGNVVTWAAGLAVIFGYGEAFLFHAGTGMDTMLAAWANALVVGMAGRLADRPSWGRAAVSALAAWLAVQARPDNVIVAVLCPVLALLLLAPAPRGRALAWFVGLTVALLGLDVLLKWWLLGTPLPLSFYAKQPGHYGGFAGEFSWNPLWFMQVFLGAAAPFLLAMLLFAGRASARTLLVLLGPALLTISAVMTVNQIMGHLGRFYFPLLPLFVVAGARAVADGLDAVTDERDTARVARRLVLRLALAMLVLGGGSLGLHAAGTAWAARAPRSVAAVSDRPIAAATPLPELDSWQASQEMAELAAIAPAGSRMAMSEHGLVGARARATVIIDVLGLHDREFARRGFSAEQLWHRQPDAIWLPHPDHTEMLRQILDSPEFRRDYVFFPDAFTFGFAVRRSSPRFAGLMAAFEQRWRVAYPGLQSGDYRVN
jgi:hypothetical protein